MNHVNEAIARKRELRECYESDFITIGKGCWPQMKVIGDCIGVYANTADGHAQAYKKIAELSEAESDNRVAYKIVPSIQVAAALAESFRRRIGVLFEAFSVDQATPAEYENMFQRLEEAGRIIHETWTKETEELPDGEDCKDSDIEEPNELQRLAALVTAMRDGLGSRRETGPANIAALEMAADVGAIKVVEISEAITAQGLAASRLECSMQAKHVAMAVEHGVLDTLKALVVLAHVGGE